MILEIFSNLNNSDSHLHFICRSSSQTPQIHLLAERNDCEHGTWRALPAFLSVAAQLVWAYLVQALSSGQALTQDLQGHWTDGLGKALLFFFFFSCFPNQLTVNPWHTTSIKGHRTIPVCAYPAEKQVKRCRLTLTSCITYISLSSPDNPKAH